MGPIVSPSLFARTVMNGRRRNSVVYYPPIAIGCCFYDREGNYQAVIRSIEKMAATYPNDVRAFIYFSGKTDLEKHGYLEKLRFRHRDIFAFEAGPNRGDDQDFVGAYHGRTRPESRSR